MEAEYCTDLGEFIKMIVSYHGGMHIDDLIELIKLHKGQKLTVESAVQLGGLVREGDIVRATVR